MLDSFMPAFRGLGAALRLLRQRVSLSQAAVAKMAGMKQTTLSAYESERTEPGIWSLDKLLEALGADLAVLDAALRTVRGEAPRPDRRLSDDDFFREVGARIWSGSLAGSREALFRDLAAADERNRPRASLSVPPEESGESETPERKRN